VGITTISEPLLDMPVPFQALFVSCYSVLWTQSKQWNAILVTPPKYQDVMTMENKGEEWGLDHLKIIN
jgi:hypothetical protein